MLFYVAIALVVVAQGVGIYGLKTRKPDLVFTLTVIGLIFLAAIVAYFGTSGTLH